MKGFLAYCGLSLILWSWGCEGLLPDDDQVPLPTEVFDELWQGFDNRYAAFATRPVDWSAQYHRHRAKINDGSGDDELFSACCELILSLRDPHVWLRRPGQGCYTMDHLGYDRNLDPVVIEQLVGELQTPHRVIRMGHIGSCGYLAITLFPAKEGIVEAFDAALASLADCPVIILDIRNNEGGNGILAGQIAGRFVDHQRLWLTTRTRLSDGRFDEPHDWFIEPQGEVSYTRPVILLTGRYTISAAERFTLAMRLLPQVTVIGDATAGSQGSVAEVELKNGWVYALTYESCLDGEGISHDLIGVRPDLFVSATSADFAVGRDPILQRAVTLAQSMIDASSAAD